ncbi:MULTISPECIES: pyruvate kinase [unclassified Pseudactinotalea]|uniref:pyruvate kinase n=1 Tax=unclassified Pseudactinotalea TaxID=2649176 RepID=UPI00128E5744|nr:MULTISPECIES: pyruvate kinase [unclassified Pseudactinotalea]MPV49928.1 pyruvate kinase [Pseudactinotalea sp. HY160]QGH69189.1 pyruvate kinase [Pseudactinotalea sp. HY158]
MRRAKIVCTLGPATESDEMVQALVDAGMDVARINRSHGDAEDHARVYHRVRAAAEASGRAVAVLVDLQGPKIRLGRFAEGHHELAEGDIFTITTEDVPGTKELVSTTFKGLPQDVSVGDAILIDDGRVTVRVTDVTATRVTTRVEVPGPVSNNKGLNLPGVAVNVPALSEKDAEDLRWALDLGADFIALSFVRSAADYDDVRAIMDEKGRIVPVVAKIEKPQAVDNLEEIVDAFDGIMVARGDLGVELPLEQVPIVQKRAVELCQQYAKPVIVATQVLESMISSPRPTRAEASDCANAVLDGADAVMLSGETSVGKYPIVCVETMARIIATTEENGMDRITRKAQDPHTRGGVITKAANDIGEALDATYLACFTQSGDSARRMSRLRSRIPLLAFTPVADVRSRLALSWGVQTFLVPQVAHTDDMVRQVDVTLREQGASREGDRVVVVAGAPPGIAGSTNSIRVHKMGDRFD